MYKMCEVQANVNIFQRNFFHSIDRWKWYEKKMTENKKQKCNQTRCKLVKYSQGSIDSHEAIFTHKSLVNKNLMNICVSLFFPLSIVHWSGNYSAIRMTRHTFFCALALFGVYTVIHWEFFIFPNEDFSRLNCIR